MPRRARQAAEGEVIEGAEADYRHGEGEAEEVAADVKSGIKEMVMFNCLPVTAHEIEWTGHSFPAIKNLEVLRGEPAFWRLGDTRMEHML